MIGTILVIILVLLLVGAFPSWPHSQSWGYGPSGSLGLLILMGPIYHNDPAWNGFRRQAGAIAALMAMVFVGMGAAGVFARGYRFGPTVTDTNVPFVSAHVAAIPSAFSAPTSAIAASLAFSSSIGKATSTSSIAAPTAIGADGIQPDWARSPGHGGSTLTQSAHINANCRRPISPMMSASTLVISQKNVVPPKCATFSTMRSHTLSSNVRRLRYFASSSSAFAARSFASPAALAAMASRSFDRRVNASWHDVDRAAKSVSPTTPKATAKSHTTVPHRSIFFPYGGLYRAMTNSSTNPRITRAAQSYSHSSHDPIALFSASSLALFIPFRRRQGGQGRLWWLPLLGIPWALVIFWLLTLLPQ